MKKFFAIAFVAAFLVACEEKKTDTPAATTDTQNAAPAPTNDSNPTPGSDSNTVAPADTNATKKP